jgi:hypothetical protein
MQRLAEDVPAARLFSFTGLGDGGGALIESKRLRGNCAALVRHELFRSGFVAFVCAPRPGPEICTGEGERGGPASSKPSSFKRKEGKCFECHMRPCVPRGNELLAPSWVDGSTSGGENQAPVCPYPSKVERREVLRIVTFGDR